MSFFGMSKNNLSHKNNDTKNKKYSLQALVFNNKAYTDIFNHTKKCQRGISVALSARLSGSMTIEASLVVPIFLFFIINLISIVNIFNHYSEYLSQVQQSARSEAYMSCIIGQTGSNWVTDTKTFKVSPYIHEIGFKDASLSVSMTYRRWNGYDLFEGNELKQQEEYVYVTEYGYSYHTSRECKHLSISISAIGCDEIDEKRNTSGKRYYACEKCGGNGTGILFVTEQGDKYHSSANCSGLKRNVRTIKKSEVGNRVPCSECGY